MSLSYNVLVSEKALLVNADAKHKKKGGVKSGVKKLNTAMGSISGIIRCLSLYMRYILTVWSGSYILSNLYTTLLIIIQLTNVVQCCRT
jgi:polysaccharide pyruvyl transferase WcaK-like protein